MGRYYSDSQIDVVGDYQNGLHVETSAYDVSVAWAGVANTQTELFNVYGRILLLQLFCEMTVIQGGGATLIRFNCTFTTPAGVGPDPMSAVSATVANLAVGSRIVWPGGDILSTPLSTVLAAGSVTDIFPPARQIVGAVGAVGTIGHVASVADSVSGYARANCFYVPMSDNAYVEAAF